MAQTRPGLGKGLEALIPQDFDTSLLMSEDERIQKIEISQIEPNKQQPRTSFDSVALEELAGSIKRYGILQPLVVTPDGPGKYKIVAGERRWRAAGLAKLERVPAIVRSAHELEQLEIALVENVQRVDLSPLEQAVSIQRLHEQFNLAYEVIAKRLGKATTTVLNVVRLLGLPPEAANALAEKRITEGHARAILALKSASKQKELLNLIQQQGWSVRQAERYVTAHKEGIKTSQAARERVSTTTPQTQALGKVLNTSVSIRRTARGGKLEIGFKTDADLERIIKKIGS